MSGKKIQRLRGFKDILPEETEKWQKAEEIIQKVFHQFNFKEIRVPVLEQNDLFQRSIGDVTDIVQKEMYSFKDRHGDTVAMRPEGTASVVRAYIENNLFYPPSVQKLYYFGAMFRYERPQAGRLRQFHQAGAEVFGSQEPYIDAEVIVALYTILRELNIENPTVHLNSVGCEVCRPNYLSYLKIFFEKNKEGFCPLCQERMLTNPLRVLDCKVESCKNLLSTVEGTYQHLCDNCDTHFEEVKKNLNLLGLTFTLDKFLVRGLDYYTKTAFEITSSSLGSQDAIAGGGRYDKLVEELGGPKTEAVGFAIGLERLISLMPEGRAGKRPDVYMISLGETAKEKAIKLLNDIRKEGFSGEINYQDSLKSSFKKASKGNFRFAILIGDEEVKEGVVSFKDLDAGEQQRISHNASEIIAQMQKLTP
ncbi:MAG: histidine--tRNA ligase [Nitrospinae bacterium]|nr:histidine--tRNA ligase [Nitrospinota bacterium]